MKGDLDDLDRAIFALPLATPPPGLRQSILRATIAAPRAIPALAFSAWEIAGIGAGGALTVWLTLCSVANHAFALALTTVADALLRDFGDPTVLVWLAAGIATALLVTFAGAGTGRSSTRRLHGS